MKVCDATPLSDRGPKAATARTAITSLMLGAAALAIPTSAHASLLPHEVMDTAAFYLAWLVLCAMPIVDTMLFRWCI